MAKMDNDNAINALVVVLEQDRGGYHLSEQDLDSALKACEHVIKVVQKYKERNNYENEYRDVENG